MIDSSYTQGATSLHLACAAGNSEIVSLLLQYGHPWNAIDDNRKTAGEYAKECGHEEVYEQLLAEGCRAELILGISNRLSASDLIAITCDLITIVGIDNKERFRVKTEIKTIRQT